MRNILLTSCMFKSTFRKIARHLRWTAQWSNTMYRMFDRTFRTNVTTYRTFRTIHDVQHIKWHWQDTNKLETWHIHNGLHNLYRMLKIILWKQIYFCADHPVHIMYTVTRVLYTLYILLLYPVGIVSYDLQDVSMTFRM